MSETHERLIELQKKNVVPTVRAFNRIDGPGSSLDLREFQEALWTLPKGPVPLDGDEFARWSKGLPRTVGITISIGCAVEAHPHKPGWISIVSKDYGYHQEMQIGEVPFRKEFWLLKILDIFGLDGVRFELHNLVPGIKSSGLGGSATATTGVCLLANRLTGSRFSGEQLVAMASLIEQDMGISITGTQEQSNVVFGGVTDYVWFPWGVPGYPGNYGSSIRHELLPESDYSELDARMRIYHSGVERASTDVNSVWRQKLTEREGFQLHRSKLSIVHEYREGIRQRDWDRVSDAVRKYVEVRIELCSDYMTSECWDIQGQCERFDAQSFPLGAGGGGAVLVFCPKSEKLSELDASLTRVYRRIDYKLLSRGCEFSGVPQE